MFRSGVCGVARVPPPRECGVYMWLCHNLCGIVCVVGERERERGGGGWGEGERNNPSSKPLDKHSQKHSIRLGKFYGGRVETLDVVSVY